jgi:serine O-acetyltransferase
MSTHAVIYPNATRAPSLGFLATVRADLAAVARLKAVRYPSIGGLADVLMLPGTWAVLLFRTAHALHRRGLRPLSRVVYFLNVVWFGADLAPGARIGPGLAIAHPVFCGWGNDLQMGANCILTGGVRFGTAASPRRKGHPVVGDDVYFLDAAKMLGRVEIGDRAVIAANALVLDDVPSDAVVVGQPARIVRSRTDAETAVAVEDVG